MRPNSCEGEGVAMERGKRGGRDSWHVDLKAIFYGVSGSRGCGCYGNPSLTVPTIFLLHQMRWKAENNDIGGVVCVALWQFQVSVANDKYPVL
ncbi:uncharacterized protein TNCV_1419211 [Trichonephila clavipes]|uniref:Uncharacterized protein n=1 Tax=Trichonephila inaurata madagascariensis TaxID=2747483 RepID=A0A8X6Y8X1_9ARAC|nr:uncharacterized protein TNCV_1419211 [Trichonephila clavipes]GFY68291.1 uncharacterized protein TNIN_364711 [Trichonephila inaurata madagascariensis]